MAEYPHFCLPGSGRTNSYANPGYGRPKALKLPERERIAHAGSLQSQYAVAKAEAERRLAQSEDIEDQHFVSITFAGKTDHDLDVAGLSDHSNDICVLGTKIVGSRQIAHLRIPRTKLDHFEKLFTAYEADLDGTGNKTRERLVTSLEEIRLSVLDDFFGDEPSEFPELEEEIWWEVWLDTRAVPQGTHQNVAESFMDRAAKQGIAVGRTELRFPETVILLARTSRSGWSKFPRLFRDLAELRRARLVYVSDFLGMQSVEQLEYANDFASRTTFAGADSPVVCLLDRGIHAGHPLIGPAISDGGIFCWDPTWIPAARHDHGTEMAGLALYGDLTEPLETNRPVVLNHQIESVKIVPDFGENEPELYGRIASDSMEMADANSPSRPRVFCKAITATKPGDGGRPSSYSAALDQATAGVVDGTPKLLIQCVGNVNATSGDGDYPELNLTSPILDPAQAWNALSVGAITEKDQINDTRFRGYRPVAERGALCPASRTSLPWDESQWPIKPDVVFEGGNYAYAPGVDSKNVFAPDDLGLLTTRFVSGALFSVLSDTSAASAQVARLAARLWAENPQLWPETVRGLIVHSARWTDRMRTEFPDKRRADRLRVYGWGKPDFDLARESARNRATIVIEDRLQPFHWRDGGVKYREMKRYELPFPSSVLQALGDEQITMRATLSFFVAPSPGGFGRSRRNRYASHGLQFDIKRSLESDAEFLKRVSQDAKGGAPDNRSWDLGGDLRKKGSIHSDSWTGTAADLAASDSIAVFPRYGWWQERKSLERYDSEARYALIVTIETERSDVELYEAVRNEIAASTGVVAEVAT